MPIVMGTDFVELYPERSSFSKKENKLFHSPQLSFKIFDTGTAPEKERAYIEGILSVEPLLHSMGLDQKQITEFESKLSGLFA